MNARDSDDMANNSSPFYDLLFEFNQQTNDLIPIASQYEQFLKQLVYWLGTRQGSLPFNRDFGSPLWNYIYENLTDDKLQQLQQNLTTALNQWSPFPATVEVKQIDESTIQLYITFEIATRVELQPVIKIDLFNELIEVIDVQFIRYTG